MSTKHTRGPWSVEYGAGEAPNLIRGGTRSSVVAIVSEALDDGRDDWHANADLIACAPEMLDFIRQIVTEQCDLGEHGDLTIIREGEALIAKAEGK